MFDRGFFLMSRAIRRQLAAMPNDFYFIPLIHTSTHRPAPGERLWTAASYVTGATYLPLQERTNRLKQFKEMPCLLDSSRNWR
jgi:hypothetical protein